MMNELLVTLPSNLAQALRSSVEAGDYESLDEAVGDAVRFWQHHRSDNAARLEIIKARIERSLADPRPDLSSEEVDEHLSALFAEAERDLSRA